MDSIRLVGANDIRGHQSVDTPRRLTKEKDGLVYPE